MIWYVVTITNNSLVAKKAQCLGYITFPSFLFPLLTSNLPVLSTVSLLNALSSWITPLPKNQSLHSGIPQLNTDKHSSTILPATDAHKGVAKDMEGCSIGNVPIDEFLARFIPDHKKNPLGEVDIDFFKPIPETGHETKRYSPFVCD